MPAALTHLLARQGRAGMQCVWGRNIWRIEERHLFKETLTWSVLAGQGHGSRAARLVDGLMWGPPSRDWGCGVMSGPPAPVTTAH